MVATVPTARSAAAQRARTLARKSAMLKMRPPDRNVMPETRKYVCSRPMSPVAVPPVAAARKSQAGALPASVGRTYAPMTSVPRIVSYPMPIRT